MASGGADWELKTVDRTMETPAAPLLAPHPSANFTPFGVCAIINLGAVPASL